MSLGNTFISFSGLQEGAIPFILSIKDKLCQHTFLSFSLYLSSSTNKLLLCVVKMICPSPTLHYILSSCNISYPTWYPGNLFSTVGTVIDFLNLLLRTVWYGWCFRCCILTWTNYFLPLLFWVPFFAVYGYLPFPENNYESIYSI